MKKIIALAILIIIPFMLSAHYDPYHAAQGLPYVRPYPYQYQEPVRNERRDGLSASVLSAAFNTKREEARQVLALIRHTERIDERRGSAYSEALAILDTLRDIYRIRTPYGREDDALRSLSSSLDWFISRRNCTWSELEDAVSRTFPEIIRAIALQW